MSILIKNETANAQIAAHVAAPDPHGDREQATIEARKLRNRERMKQLRDDLSAAGVLTSLVYAQYFGPDGEACGINLGPQMAASQRHGVYGLANKQLIPLQNSITGNLTVVLQAGFTSIHTAEVEFILELRCSSIGAGRVGFLKQTSNSFFFYSASNSANSIELPGAATANGSVMIGTLNATTNEKTAYVNGVNVGSSTYIHTDLAALISVAHNVDVANQRTCPLGIAMIFNRVLTPTEAQNVTIAIQKNQGTRRLLQDGDSMGVTVARAGSLYGLKTATNLIRLFSEAGQKISTVTATAIGGSTPTQAIARFATDYASISPSAGQVAPVYLAWTGTNSLAALSPSAILAELRTLWGLAKAKGYVVLAVSLCRRSPYLAETLALNELIKADIGTYYDGYVDIDAELVKDFGLNYYLNTTISDGVHILDHTAHLCFWRALDRNLHLFD